jgi:hypothetical protein
MLLTSQRHAANSDVVRFTQTAQERGWGDGLPLVPATVARVEEYVEAAGLPPETVLAQMPPLAPQPGPCRYWWLLSGRYPRGISSSTD